MYVCSSCCDDDDETLVAIATAAVAASSSGVDVLWLLSMTESESSRCSVVPVRRRRSNSTDEPERFISLKCLQTDRQIEDTAWACSVHSIYYRCVGQRNVRGKAKRVVGPQTFGVS